VKTIDWGGLVTLRDWADALDFLLASARDAATKQETPARLAAQAALLEFAKRSPAMCNALDDIATAATHDLYEAQADACLRAITKRQNDLAKAVALIDAATDHAQKDVRDIQLANVVDLLDKTSAALGTLKRLEKAFDTPDENMLRKIAALEQAIAELRKLPPRG
jgi:hypothetical protein